jgi:uncharacterized Zn finger protein (UPF0148 family)
MSKTKRDQIEDNLIAEEMQDGAAECLECGHVLVTDRVGFAGCRACGQDYVIVGKRLQRIKITFMSDKSVEYQLQEEKLDDFAV